MKNGCASCVLVFIGSILETTTDFVDHSIQYDSELTIMEMVPLDLCSRTSAEGCLLIFTWLRCNS